MALLQTLLLREEWMKVEVMGTDAVWLPVDINERELDSFIEDDNYCLQTKEDGVHVLASRTQGGRVDTRNRRGEPHRIPPALEKALMGCPLETMLDGEKMHSGGFVVFDMLYHAGEDLRGQDYTRRLIHATEICLKVASPLLRVVETALGSEAKLELATRLRSSNAEGIVIKDLRATYQPGRRIGGWTMYRLKFRKSLTCILQRRKSDTKASFEMFLVDGQEIVNVGSVSAQRFFDELLPGESKIGEVSFLYSTPGRRLVQPVLKRPWPFREDKMAEECTVDQLMLGGRFASS
jgi:hypothetical protein